MALKTLSTFSRNVAGNTRVGPSLLISGRLSGGEDLIVQGRVEGEVALSHTLFVEESGIVKANVSVKNAIVSGVVVGNIRATECVELRPGGRMVGDIASPRVIIVEGASFRGHIDMGEAEALRANREHVETQPEDTSAATQVSAAVPPAVPQLASASSDHRVAVNAPSTQSLTPPDFDDETTADKPLPPEPPMLMDESRKKLVVKKKT